MTKVDPNEEEKFGDDEEEWKLSYSCSKCMESLAQLLKNKVLEPAL